ncbi:MAG: winged helix-turn-helix transcriptional regulator [Haloferacaceae archaeon]
MRDLDETDLEILELLAEDARRPWSDIADRVDLSPPAVSDRVERLRESGVIRRFTLDIDRSQLRAGVPVLVSVALGFDADVAAAVDRLADDDAVEHVFGTADGDVVCHARVRTDDVREWLAATLDGTPVDDYDVAPVTRTEWRPTAGGVDFALTCDECGNTVTSEGETARVDGEVHHFCCPSCHTRFRERYERIAEGATE